MSSLDFYQIKISRSKYIERDRSIARLRLNQHEFVVGEPVMVRYYSKPDQSEIDTIFALGIKEGVGEDCYQVISLGGLDLVRDVVTELPDVSLLVHGELYLYKDEEGVWNYVYEDGGVRQIEPITGGPFIFSNIEDKYRWFYRDGVLKREDDFYTKSEINEMISGWDVNIQDALKSIEEIKKLAYKNYSASFPLKVSFYDSNKQEDGTTPLYKVGVRTAVNFLIRVTVPDIDITTGESASYEITNDCELELNGNPITLPEDNRYTVIGLTNTTEYRLVVKYTDPNTGIVRMVTSYYTVKFGHSFYYGQIPKSGWEVTEYNLNSLPFNVVGDENSIITFSGDLNSQKLAFAYPKDYGNLRSIYDTTSGLNHITDYSIETCKVNNVDYNVYIKDVSLNYEGFQQVYSFSLPTFFEGTSTEDSVVNVTDLENLRQEILGGASISYNTLGKIEQIIKSLSVREGFVGGPGINLKQLEDGSTEISVNVDKSSIVTDSNMSIAAKNISGGKY